MWIGKRHCINNREYDTFQTVSLDVPAGELVPPLIEAAMRPALPPRLLPEALPDAK
jgi:hypothetical protein